MTAVHRIVTNRMNARRSTGPRTAAGLARSAQNAMKFGLFSQHLVLPVLGESADECDAFRARVVADLDPVGALEVEFADRVALIMWRLRRVARAEAAAMGGAVGSLPPHPADVKPAEFLVAALPPAPGATAADRLARLRAQLFGAPEYLAGLRAAVAVLDPAPSPEAPIDGVAANRALWAAGDELGWAPTPDPWPPVLAAAGLAARELSALKWTVARVRHVLGVMADRAGRGSTDLIRAARERLEQAVAEHERTTAERRDEEARLVAELLREREAVAAARVYADDALVQRVARAEGHLSRELDRALALLAARRADRRGRRVVGGE